jgi:hypothetical protein
MGRVANHVRDTLNLSDEEAESITRRDAETFVDQKDYLLSIWEDRR